MEDFLLWNLNFFHLACAIPGHILGRGYSQWTEWWFPFLYQRQIGIHLFFMTYTDRNTGGSFVMKTSELCPHSGQNIRVCCLQHFWTYLVLPVQNDWKGFLQVMTCCKLFFLLRGVEALTAYSCKDACGFGMRHQQPDNAHMSTYFWPCVIIIQNSWDLPVAVIEITCLSLSLCLSV